MNYNSFEFYCFFSRKKQHTKFRWVNSKWSAHQNDDALNASKLCEQLKMIVSHWSWWIECKSRSSLPVDTMQQQQQQQQQLTTSIASDCRCRSLTQALAFHTPQSTKSMCERIRDNTQSARAIAQCTRYESYTHISRARFFRAPCDMYIYMLDSFIHTLLRQRDTHVYSSFAANPYGT